MKKTAFAIAIALAALGSAAISLEAMGNETITYTYDAKGRVVRVRHSGTVNNNQQANYTYDDAANRLNYNVTGAP